LVGGHRHFCFVDRRWGGTRGGQSFSLPPEVGESGISGPKQTQRWVGMAVAAGPRGGAVRAAGAGAAPWDFRTMAAGGVQGAGVRINGAPGGAGGTPSAQKKRDGGGEKTRSTGPQGGGRLGDAGGPRPKLGAPNRKFLGPGAPGGKFRRSGARVRGPAARILRGGVAGGPRSTPTLHQPAASVGPQSGGLGHFFPPRSGRWKKIRLMLVRICLGRGSPFCRFGDITPRGWEFRGWWF